MMYTVSRVLPFALYIGFIAIAEVGKPFMDLPDAQAFFDSLYPIKIGLVMLALVLLRKWYSDINWADLKHWPHTTISFLIGLAVYVAWVNMTWPFAISGELSAFEPPHGFLGKEMQFTIRFLGACIIVPIMEEVFWRSFLARYLIKRDFIKVPPGTFTLFTFAATSVLFGLEHQLWLAGVLAGTAYNYIYMKSGSVVQCIFSHGVTNAALGIHVLITQEWHFW